MKTLSREQIAAERARVQADQRRRLDLDVGDCALSSWAGDAVLGAFRVMEIALDAGEQYGIDGPACEVAVLIDVASNEVVPARKVWSEKFRKSDWLLEPEAAEKYGRRYVPWGFNSKVQKSLGLRQGLAVFPARANLGSACAGRGLPVSYFAEPLEGAAPIAVRVEV